MTGRAVTARLAAPSLAGVAVRLSQLLVLVALTGATEGPSRTAIVAAFGLAAAFAVLSDAGAVAFILATGWEHVTGWSVTRCIGIQLAVGLLGAASGLVVCVGRFPMTREPAVLLVVLCLLVTPVVDSAVRVVRAHWLRQSADHRFAMYDGLSAVSKAIAAGTIWSTGDIVWAVLLPLPPVALLMAGWMEMKTVLPRGGRVRGLPGAIFVFGANGAASALYSQSPMVIAALTLPVEAVAVLTICYRITQPLELVPSTLAQQAIPRFASGGLSLVALFSGFAALGAACAAGVIATIPIAENLFSTALEPRLIIVFIACALPVKFGNYAMAASLLAHHRVRAKLRLTILVGLVAVIVAGASGRLGSSTGVAFTTLLAELGLLAGMYLTTRGAAHGLPRPRTVSGAGPRSEELR